jgi:hypothetical protein
LCLGLSDVYLRGERTIGVAGRQRRGPPIAMVVTLIVIALSMSNLTAPLRTAP